MMINKRLLSIVPSSRKYIVWNVMFQWISLLSNICIMTGISCLMAGVYTQKMESSVLWITGSVIFGCVLLRFLCTILSARMGYLSSKEVKGAVRENIYQKLLKLGTSYRERVNTSEIVQVAVEGVELLDTYFGAYLPQFFYAMLAPLTLFLYLSFYNIVAALVLFICVPLIPVAIATVQTWAKKLLSKYWGQYTKLGDTFLENLQGLTTLKIYQADKYKHDEMNQEAEKFRKITMKVLSMQLNSVTIMDFLAYGGAALGGILAVSQYRGGHVSLMGAILIILLSADFFIPMRQLGSYFHVAMNGMAASDKIFKLLDIEDGIKGEKIFPENKKMRVHISFSYDKDRKILDNVQIEIKPGEMTAIVGTSGSGKSTIASILTGTYRGYQGNIMIGHTELRDISEKELLKHITYVGHQDYIFKGSVRETLLMGKADASEEEMWEMLQRVRLHHFFREQEGLDTKIMEGASNLSGGQRQRLALARAILHDSPCYIFDEATSNIDVESENDIMEEIMKLAKKKTVLLISHRLMNVVNASQIYVLNQGGVSECGTHNELLEKNGIYAAMWNSQQELESFGKEETE